MSQLKNIKYFLFALSILITSAVHGSPSCVAEKTCVPIKLDNQTGVPIYALIFGSATKKFYNFLNATYSETFHFNDNVIRLDHTMKTIYLPGNGIAGGARMYFSTHPLEGIPDLATYPYVHDKIEMGWSPHTAVWNTTSVDFFGMPIQLIQGNMKTGFKDESTRQAILHDLKQAMSMESDLYNDRFFFKDGEETLRIFSPQHFYTNLPNLWEPAITKGLDELMMDDPTKGTGVYFNFNYGGTQYTHLKKLSNDSLLVDENGKTKTITEITTGNAAAGQIKPIGNQFAGLLAATINRGVLGNPSYWGQNGMPNKGFPEYYYLGKSGQYLYNTYAKILIDHSIAARTYATPYDDYWHMDSSLQVGPDNNQPVTIKLLPFH